MMAGQTLPEPRRSLASAYAWAIVPATKSRVESATEGPGA